MAYRDLGLITPIVKTTSPSSESIKMLLCLVKCKTVNKVDIVIFRQLIEVPHKNHLLEREDDEDGKIQAVQRGVQLGEDKFKNPAGKQLATFTLTFRGDTISLTHVPSKKFTYLLARIHKFAHYFFWTAQGKDSWKAVIKEAKAHEGLKCQIRVRDSISSVRH